MTRESTTEPPEQPAAPMTVDERDAMFRNLVSTYYGDILKRSRSFVGDNSIFDVTQETFLEAYNSLESVKSPSAIKSWLNTLHKRAVSKYVKRKRFPKQLECKESEGLELSMTDHAVDSFKDSMQKEGYRQIITEIMNGLDEKDSALLQCLYWEGYSVKEAALKFELSESNVKVKAHRLKKYLIDKMVSEDSEFTAS